MRTKLMDLHAGNPDNSVVLIYRADCFGTQLGEFF